MTTPIPPSGGQLDLRAGRYTAVITQVGAGLRRLTHDGIDVVDPFAEDEVVTGGRGQLLAPWPNRVRDGRYEAPGEDQPRQLDLSEPARGNATHGLVRWTGWTVEAHRPAPGDGPAAVTLVHRLPAHPGYPHVLDLSATYTLDATDGLAVTVTATNRGATAAPWGLGAHPYLRAGGPGIEGCTLALTAGSVLVPDDRGIPVARLRVADAADLVGDLTGHDPLAGRELDHAFTDLQREPDGHAVITLTDPGSSASTTLWADESFAYVQVYTGDRLRPTPRTGLAVEPMTCAPDAYNSGGGLRWLRPGETVEHRFGIAATGHG